MRAYDWDVTMVGQLADLQTAHLMVGTRVVATDESWDAPKVGSSVALSVATMACPVLADWLVDSLVAAMAVAMAA